MGDSRSAIADDEDYYLSLCNKYGEQARWDLYGIDIYGNHAIFLEKYNQGQLGADFQKAKSEFFGEIERKEKEIKEKIAAAKAKLTEEEIKLLGIKA